MLYAALQPITHVQFISFLYKHNCNLWHVVVINSCTLNSLKETQFITLLSLSGLLVGGEGLGSQSAFNTFLNMVFFVVTSLPYT